MPHITAKKSPGCGDSKRGTFCTDHEIHPHHGGHPSGVKGGKAHLHGGHPIPKTGPSTAPDVDNDGDYGRDTDSDGM